MGVWERLAAAAAVRRVEESGVKSVLDPSPSKTVTRSEMAAAGPEVMSGLKEGRPGSVNGIWNDGAANGMAVAEGAGGVKAGGAGTAGQRDGVAEAGAVNAAGKGGRAVAAA